MDDVTRHAATPVAALRWAVAGTIDTDTGPVDIGTGFEASATDSDGGRRVVRINGAPARRQASLGELMAAVWLIPDMDRLFMDRVAHRG